MPGGKDIEHIRKILSTELAQDKVDITLKDMNAYLNKLVTQDLGFGQQIEDALKKIQIQKEMNDWNAPSYRITINDRLEKIPVKHIYYAKKDGKNVVFYTRDGKSSIRKSLAQVYAELPEGDFIYVDQSCLVNMMHVMKLKLM